MNKYLHGSGWLLANLGWSFVEDNPFRVLNAIIFCLMALMGLSFICVDILGDLLFRERK